MTGTGPPSPVLPPPQSDKRPRTSTKPAGDVGARTPRLIPPHPLDPTEVSIGIRPLGAFFHRLASATERWEDSLKVRVVCDAHHPPWEMRLLINLGKLGAATFLSGMRGFSFYSSSFRRFSRVINDPSPESSPVSGWGLFLLGSSQLIYHI